MMLLNNSPQSALMMMSFGLYIAFWIKEMTSCAFYSL
jgi:hypothetical protein